MAGNHYMAGTNRQAGVPASYGYPIGQVQPPPSFPQANAAYYNPVHMVSPAQSLSSGGYLPGSPQGGPHSCQYIHPSHTGPSEKPAFYESVQNHYVMDSPPPPYIANSPPGYQNSRGHINFSSEKQPLTSTYSGGWSQAPPTSSAQTPTKPCSSSRTQEMRMVHPSSPLYQREELRLSKSASKLRQDANSQTQQLAEGYNLRNTAQYIHPQKTSGSLENWEVIGSPSHSHTKENHRLHQVYPSSENRAQGDRDRDQISQQQRVQQSTSASRSSTQEDTETVGLIALVAGLAIAPAAGLLAAGVGSHIASKAQEGRRKKQKEKE